MEFGYTTHEHPEGSMNNAAVGGSSDTRRTALGTLLIERGLLDDDRLQQALEISEENGERLGEVLVRLAWVSEDDLAKVLAEQWQLRYYERSAISFDGEALKRMSREDAARLEALPIQVDHQGVLVVALAEPTESRLMALRTLLGDNVDFVVVAKGAIDAGLRSDLLARTGGGQFEPFAEGDEPVAAEVELEVDEAPLHVQLPEPVPFWEDAPSSATSFDEVAQALNESVGAHLETLRALLAEAERDRENDRRELERLQVELGERDSALASTQQLLRDLADKLVPAQPE